ncbi:L-asparaginase II [mine drainage metagenome]|uniref:L-asparaginase II n=1 Tax=mine drainage metagenome TaxID=410659 RepID=A0A1J5QHN4_9ZZZZ
MESNAGLIELAQLVRNDFVESRHFGSLFICDKDGAVLLSLGDVAQPVFPRSAVKPFQAIAMVRNGLDLPDRLLALSAASHSGSDLHVAGVKAILATAGLTEGDLQCPLDRPYGDTERKEYGTTSPSRIVHNCSGKHASMLVTSVINGWPIDSYLDPKHPLQLAIRADLEAVAQEEVAATGVDGCGAPLFAISLIGLARAFSTLTTSEDSSTIKVARAMRAFPEMVAGEKRFTTELMRLVPGLLVKEGAEGVEAAVDQNGNAIAFKIIDGSMRAIPPVLIESLGQLGIGQDSLTELGKVPVLGGGRPVGEIRAMPLS